MLVTRNPTANLTPDPDFVGSTAVLGASNTGHNDTGVSGGENKSCRWTAFQKVSGLVLSSVLKVDWFESGVLSGGNSTFQLQYSLNNGSSWNNFFAFPHTDLDADTSGTAQVTLSLSQDLTQVRVRDDFTASGGATLTINISNIHIDVTISDEGLLLGGM